MYVLEGSIFSGIAKEGEEVEEEVLKKGSLLFNEAYEAHAIKSLEDSKLLILTRGLRGGKDYETDNLQA